MMASLPSFVTWKSRPRREPDTDSGQEWGGCPSPPPSRRRGRAGRLVQALAGRAARRRAVPVRLSVRANRAPASGRPGGGGQGPARPAAAGRLRGRAPGAVDGRFPVPRAAGGAAAAGRLRRDRRGAYPGRQPAAAAARAGPAVGGGPDPLADVEDSAAFPEAYQAVRGRRWTSGDYPACWAAGLWQRVFDARVQSLAGDPEQILTRREARARLLLAGLDPDLAIDGYRS